jgi:hypothetical protein
MFKKITFPTLCEYGFKTWEVGYIARKDELTMQAIEAVGLSGELKPTDEQIKFLWTELEHLYIYQIIVYANACFGGKQTSKDISYVVSQKYIHFLLMGLRKDDEATAEKALDGFMEFFEDVERILNTINDTTSIETDSLATFGVMIMSQHVEAKMPEYGSVATTLIQNHVWASSKSLYNLGKITWE